MVALVVIMPLAPTQSKKALVLRVQDSVVPTSIVPRMDLVPFVLLVVLAAVLAVVGAVLVLGLVAVADAKHLDN
jgi:hypothetical protein